MTIILPNDGKGIVHGEQSGLHLPRHIVEERERERVEAEQRQYMQPRLLLSLHGPPRWFIAPKGVMLLELPSLAHSVRSDVAVKEPASNWAIRIVTNALIGWYEEASKLSIVARVIARLRNLPTTYREWRMYNALKKQ